LAANSIESAAVLQRFQTKIMCSTLCVTHVFSFPIAGGPSRRAALAALLLEKGSSSPSESVDLFHEVVAQDDRYANVLVLPAKKQVAARLSLSKTHGDHRVSDGRFGGRGLASEAGVLGAVSPAKPSAVLSSSLRNPLRANHSMSASRVEANNAMPI